MSAHLLSYLASSIVPAGWVAQFAAVTILVQQPLAKERIGCVHRTSLVAIAVFPPPLQGIVIGQISEQLQDPQETAYMTIIIELARSSLLQTFFFSLINLWHGFCSVLSLQG